MKARLVAILKVGGWLVAAGVLVGISTAAMPRVKEWWKPGGDDADTAAKGDTLKAELVPGHPNTLQLPAGVKASLGVRATEVRKAIQGRTLELSGSLAPDTDFLAPVRSRFAGEVVEIEQIPHQEGTQPTEKRPVRNGDQVEEGQLLAVVWSKDLGQQKSTLIDAVSKLRLDEDTLKRMETLYRQGGITQQSFSTQERNVQGDQIAVAAAERTLRSWKLTDKEIKAIYDEANEVAARNTHGEKPMNKDQEKNWARVEVRAPIDGVIIEKNVTRGAIIDTTTNLFMVGDLRHLSVWANIFEEDLPALQALPRPIPWEIRFENDPGAKPVKGTISEIRPIIDPTQHSALAKGRVTNPENKLVSGQFITATIQLPPAPNEVIIPTTALIEDGQESIVFVQDNPKEDRYSLRHVAVARRGRDQVNVRFRGLTAKDKERHAEPLKPGEMVVTSGALEMKAALRNLQDTSATVKK